MFWLGLGMTAVGLAMLGAGQVRIRDFRGNLATKTKGNVNQMYVEAASQPESAKSNLGDLVLNWGGFAISLAGLAVSILSYLNGH